jgi:DmsE family decaheme c-type cytochrome
VRADRIRFAFVVLLCLWGRVCPHAGVPDSPDIREISCIDCHPSPVHDFLLSPHAAAFHGKGLRGAQELCGPCHGTVTAHGEAKDAKAVPVEFRFKDPKTRDATVVSARCLACHGAGSRPVPAGGIHLRNGLNCLDCHTGMNRGGLSGLRKESEITLCGRCHPQSVAPFRSGHRVDRAGALCTFCHDPHAEERRLPGRVCTDCHKAYAFPKPFQHPPVEEGCPGCHDPHGSAERFLLREARPALCFGCHSQLESLHRVDAAASPFRLYEACQNCHPRIHGSDGLGGAKFQR